MLIWNCYDCICSYLMSHWEAEKKIYMHVCFLNFRNCPHFKLPLFFRCSPWTENWYFFVCILEKKIRNNSVPYLRVPHFLTRVKFILHWHLKKTKQNIGLLNFLKLGLRKPDWVSRHWPIFSGCHRNNLNRAKQQMFSVFSHDSYNLSFFLSSL